MKLLHIFYLLLLSQPLFSQNQYEGFIGSYPIHLELLINEEGGSCTGYYFYDSQLKHIPLSGSFSTEEILLTSHSWEDEEEETISLQKDKNGLSGTWKKGEKEYSISLKSTDKFDDYFEAYTTAQLDFKIDSFSDSLIWMKETHSGVSMFRLTNVFTQEIKEFANQKLDSIHVQNALVSLHCEATNEIGIHSLSSDILSFSNQYFVNCFGSAHPSYGVATYNLDLQNQEKYGSLTDFFGNDLYIQYLKEKYQNIEREEDITDCDLLSNQEITPFQYAQWLFLKNGDIEIITEHPHAYKACTSSFFLNSEEITYLQNLNIPDLSGRWSWQEGQNTVSIDITRNEYDVQYYLKYCSVFENGRKIDCSEYQKAGSLQQEADGFYTGEFFSSSWKGKGKISLTYNIENQSLIVETYEKEGVSYLPNQGEFTR